MIRHHPSIETLSGYARGSLPAGMALVVSCHLHGCDACRREVAVWEKVGGVLLQAAEPIALADDALARALARIERSAATSDRASRKLPDFLEQFSVPALRGQEIGARLWLTPSIWFAPVRIEPESQSRTYLVYAKKDTSLPVHTHRGREFTAVLHGSFRDGPETFEEGDFEEADESLSHAPAVTAEMECLCVISADAPMLLKGRIARMVQSLAGNLY
jgi:putative transcriptional regulator